VKGEIYAIGNVCTHQFALLTDGYVEAEEYVECPLHQARFHIPTGKTQGPPADDDVKTYPTKVHEGRILVGIEDDS
jgi:nitrite reductase/ring-hydroxylating ferredoxin subunit